MSIHDPSYERAEMAWSEWDETEGYALRAMESAQDARDLALGDRPFRVTLVLRDGDEITTSVMAASEAAAAEAGRAVAAQRGLDLAYFSRAVDSALTVEYDLYGVAIWERDGRHVFQLYGKRPFTLSSRQLRELRMALDAYCEAFDGAEAQRNVQKGGV